MSSFAVEILLERIRCGVGRRLGRDVALERAATEVRVFNPGEEIAGYSAIALPGQYDRIRSCAFDIDVRKEVAQLDGAARPIGPTRRYTIADAVISGGIIYRRGAKAYFKELDEPSTSRCCDLDDVALRSSFLGCHYFGHWLRDDCATHLLAERDGPPFGMPTPPWPDREHYKEAFAQDYPELVRARVKRLFLYEDISQNTHKADRLRTLRQRLAGGRDYSRKHIVYLRRGPSGAARGLVNDHEVTECLAAEGVRVVTAENTSAKQLIEEMLGARIVISVEGSQLSHSLYTMREDGGLLIIQPPRRFFNSHFDWARALGMHYAIVVGEDRPEGFYLPPQDLLRTLERLDDAIG